jgi:dipeptidase D
LYPAGFYVIILFPVHGNHIDFIWRNNMASFEGLKPENLWKHFSEILKIPRCSGHETAIGDYIISFAKETDLEWDKDAVGNVVIRKKASPGHEDAFGVILQGHLDMVCEKNSDIEHDFSKDPIQTEIEGEWIHAKGTTLGADNGIGIAASLSIMEEEGLVHGLLEALFTVEEETGLTGATQISPDFLKGKYLLNLDSEDEGEFTIGCAGGADTKIFLTLERESQAEGEPHVLKVKGLKGGHSGVDIDLGRANAIQVLARLLWKISASAPIKLSSIEGGNLRNAIPREAQAVFSFDPGQKDNLTKALETAFVEFKEEYRVIEPDAGMEFVAFEGDVLPPLTEESQKKLVNFLFTMPHGVISFHAEMEGLVETSTNLAVILTHQDKSEIICSTRSSVASALQATRDNINALGQLVGAEVIQEEGYPGWTPNLASPLLKTLKEVYKKTFDKEPKVAAIHAGLECGIIGEKYPDMDKISFGPTIKFPHSPDEKVHIGDVDKFYDFLKALISELA